MELKYEKAIYCKEVILRTAYVFIEDAYLHISQNASQWIVSWKPKKNNIVSPEEFENELICQQLRYQLINSHKDMRNILLGRAMATTLIEKPGEAKAPKNCDKDIHNILKGWFDE